MLTTLGAPLVQESEFGNTETEGKYLLVLAKMNMNWARQNLSITGEETIMMLVRK